MRGIHELEASDFSRPGKAVIMLPIFITTPLSLFCLARPEDVWDERLNMDLVKVWPDLGDIETGNGYRNIVGGGMLKLLSQST